MCRLYSFSLTGQMDTQGLNPNPQNMATALIIATFDHLSSAIHRNEPNHVMFSLKSFLINKLPLLLGPLQTSMFPMTPGACISEALSHIDPTAYSAFSQSFDDMAGASSALKDVRQAFLTSCALHGMIPADAVERLLGETPTQAPPGIRHTKADLLKQCKDSIERVNALIEDLERLDGNGGAIAGAVTEVKYSHLARLPLTMRSSWSTYVRRKRRCTSRRFAISSRPSHMHRRYCFSSRHQSPFSGPSASCWTSGATTPIRVRRADASTRVLNRTVEHQPVYDEFGAVLVLVLAFIYRFELEREDLGIDEQSFVAQLLTRDSKAIDPDNLTEEQDKSFSSWIEGLLGSDIGIGDELMSSCPPQQFYFIAPTLYCQIVLACSEDALSMDAVKGAIECAWLLLLARSFTDSTQIFYKHRSSLPLSAGSSGCPTMSSPG